MAEDKATVVRTGGNNVGLIFLSFAILIAAIVGFLFYQSEQSKNEAVSGAASAVTDTAKKVSDSVKPSGN